MIIKKGDIVARKSYGKDIMFFVKNIFHTKKETIATLKGVVDRIEADSDIHDLEKVDKKIIEEKINKLTKKIDTKIKDEYKIGIVSDNKRNKEKIVTGKILHLDGECSFIYTLQSYLNTEFKKI